MSATALQMSGCEYEYKDTKNESNSQLLQTISERYGGCEYEYKDTKNESNSQRTVLTSL